MPIQLHPDILYEIVGEVASIDNKDHRRLLLNLSLTCRTLLHATRPTIFAKIKWPHQNQHDEESGLLFPPEALWPYIKSFYLDWPDHWPDSSPPLWGTKETFGHSKGVYRPKHLDKVELALPKMNRIHTFQITCPFCPPTSLLTALVGCPNIKDLKVIDTPLNTDVIPVRVPPDFNLESFSLTAAGEALRVGEGPFDPKFTIAYFSREYRRNNFTNVHGRFASIRYLFQLTRANNLRYLQLSGGSFTLLDLEEHEWPNLNTLVLTGIPFVGAIARLVVARMPKLFDLRLLFAKTNRYQGFEILPPPQLEANRHFPENDRFKKSNQIFSQITHLAVSNACDLQNTFQHVPNLERLVISAIAEHPRIPIACTTWKITEVLDDIILGGGNTHLKQVRLLMEDNIPISLLKILGDNYPLLELVEIELCRYSELPSVADEDWADSDWSQFATAFSSLQHLREFRIAMPRVGCHLSCADAPNPDPAQHAHLHVGECVRANRLICATYLSTRLPSLQKVGLQYRTRTGDYRSENRWLDYRIERLDYDDGTASGTVRLHELGQTWYPFPEVWEAVPFDE